MTLGGDRLRILHCAFAISFGVREMVLLLNGGRDKPPSCLATVTTCVIIAVTLKNKAPELMI